MPINALNALSRCPICRMNPSSSRGCCSSCYKNLFTPTGDAQLITLGAYEGRLERAIRAYKFHGTTKLSGLFASELSAAIRRNQWEIDAVCAVPLHTLRFLQRGYNQAAVLAKELAAQLELPYLRALVRVRRTRQQARLTRAERFDNVRAAFRVTSSVANLSGKRILLVDDVITSGATNSSLPRNAIQGRSTISQACRHRQGKTGSLACSFTAIKTGRINLLIPLIQLPLKPAGRCDLTGF